MVMIKMLEDEKIWVWLICVIKIYEVKKMIIDIHENLKE